MLKWFGLAIALKRVRTSSWQWRLLAPALLTVAAVAFMAYVPYLISDFYLNVLTEILIYGLLATSINILMGYTGLTSLGHAAYFGLAAYTCAYLSLTDKQGFLVSFFAGLAVGTVSSLLFGAIALRATGIYFLMITLALNMLVFGTAYTLSPITNAENGMYGISRPDFIFADYQYYWFTLAVIVVSLFLVWRLVHSPFGLTLMGIRESESRMRTLGYNVFLHKLIAFTISGFFAGLAGCLYVFFQNGVSPATVDLPVSIEGVLEVLIGGIGTLFGPMIGAAIIVTTREILSLQIGRWPTVLGLTLILIVLFARNGILGLIYKWRAQRHGMSSGSETGREEFTQLTPQVTGEAAALADQPPATSIPRPEPW